jgi:hypothetical protein
MGGDEVRVPGDMRLHLPDHRRFHGANVRHNGATFQPRRNLDCHIAASTHRNGQNDEVGAVDRLGGAGRVSVAQPKPLAAQAFRTPALHDDLPRSPVFRAAGRSRSRSARCRSAPAVDRSSISRPRQEIGQRRTTRRFASSLPHRQPQRVRQAVAGDTAQNQAALAQKGVASAAPRPFASGKWISRKLPMTA